MRKVLVVYAHPDYSNSRMNKNLIEKIQDMDLVTVSNLYNKYPDDNIDVIAEQKLMEEHDLIILQFPFYWFNTTPLMKKWLDQVLAFGFAYGVGGDKLHGKEFMLCITTGGSEERYANEVGFTLPELLKPFEYTAKFCNMEYRNPFIVADNTINDNQLHQHTQNYEAFITQYINGESLVI